MGRVCTCARVSGLYVLLRMALPCILRYLQLKALGPCSAGPLASFFPSFEPHPHPMPCLPGGEEQVELPSDTLAQPHPQEALSSDDPNMSLASGQEEAPFHDLRNQSLREGTKVSPRVHESVTGMAV